ncbi:MAG: DUF4960 domain-containing protein [Muribaculaceae bacterium]|nr:DUF4960 domain-containing protein [Muribaculaceae bacterium]
MNKLMKYSLSIATMAIAGMFGACTDIATEIPELPNLPTVSNLKAEVANRVVNLSWTLPSSSKKIEGVTLKVNNNTEVGLDATATSYSVVGQPMEDEYMYTVKVKYEGGYMSEGQSVIATVPYEQLADLTSFTVSNIEKRNVTFSWTLPNASGITGVWVGLDGEESGTVFNISEYPNGATIGGQKTGVDLKFRAKVIYDEAYYSDGIVVNTALPEMEVRVGYLLLADSPADLPDDDELAAAAWFNDNYVETDKGDFIPVAELPNIDFDEYGVIWIEVDRVGLALGWQNLPANLVSETTLNALKAYGLNGGSLYLANMATQMTVPLGIVPENMPVNIFGSGDGDPNNADLWSINPHLGWIFQNEGRYYDRASHAVYEGLAFEMVNGYEYSSLPLLGGTGKEDHNSMWDLNPYWNEAGNPAPDCVKWFENTTNSQVLAVWGQVADHCVAGMVDFSGNAVHGKCIAMGLGAYEWHVNAGVNPYQGNIEKLTENILNYLK